MKFIQFKEALKDFTIFSIHDIKMLDLLFHRRRLREWQEKGYIRKVIKGWYIFSELEINENILFEIANRIYMPSYISLEMALSYHGLIPEITYEVTSVSTRRTYAFETPIAKFIYRALKPDLFFGYEIVSYSNKSFKIATIEKAVLDYFYLNPHLTSRDDFTSLRFNAETFLNRFRRKKWESFLTKFSNKTLLQRVSTFMDTVDPGQEQNHA